MPALLGCLTILSVYQSTVDTKLLSQNERLALEMGRLKSLKHHKERAVQTLRSQIDRLQSHREEELFHARLRLGMLNGGELVYQFPHGREHRRLLEEPSR